MPLHHPPAPTGTTVRPPAPDAARAPGPTLEDRLALADATMTARLAEAAVAYEVNTAHLATEPLDLADVVTLPLAPPPPPDSPAETHPTPVAALLQRAHHRLATRGWCTGRLVDEDGARCLLGALRAEAHGDPRLEGDAADVLLDTIRRTFGADVPSVPHFNDAFGSPTIPLRLLTRAITTATTRGL
ncbi:hypothetical protein [Streptomyces sp. NPDC101132]|uniref:DUF6197 family protein n=1 Tax=Streptomyces sp. NPDC101132 TaxID=3366110 RepID=UPI0038284017